MVRLYSMFQFLCCYLNIIVFVCFCESLGVSRAIKILDGISPVTYASVMVFLQENEEEEEEEPVHDIQFASGSRDQSQFYTHRGTSST